MTADGGIVERRDGPALWLTLARADKANAYTQAMLTALESAVVRAELDATIRVLVITGDGDRVFCAGADRAELASRDWRAVPNLAAARTFARLQASPLPVVAAINGAAVGGGFELALHCDIRVASDHATFFLPEPEVGLLPAAGGIRLLPALVGALRASDLIVGGARWSAAEALRAGLLSAVVPADDLHDGVASWVQRVVSRDAAALAWAKRLITPTGDPGLDRLAQAALVREQRKE